MTDKKFTSARDTTNNTKKRTLAQPKPVVEGVTKNVSAPKSLSFADVIHILSEENNAGKKTQIVSAGAMPVTKALINYGGKKRGRREGGVKGLIEDMAFEYFKNHPDEFEGFEYSE